MKQALLYESHCHTPLCKHATGEPADYAAAAIARGLRGITFTCHAPLPGGFSSSVRMNPDQFPEYVAMILDTRERFLGRLDVRLGIESDFYPGVSPWLEQLHASAPFSHVLGSVHYQIPEYRALMHPGSAAGYREVYFEQLALSAESGLFDTLAHPDLIKNDSPADWRFEETRHAVARALDRIAATGVAMELNTSGRLKSVPEMNPSPAMLEMMRERDIPVVLGADAHTPQRVGDAFPEALALLAKAGYRHVSHFIDRKRIDVPIDAALGSLPAQDPVTGLTGTPRPAK